MAYALEITPTFRRQFKKLKHHVQLDVRRKLDALCANPFKASLDIKKLSGRDGYRLRIGDYRILYLLDNKRLVVVALEVGHRKEIY